MTFGQHCSISVINHLTLYNLKGGRARLQGGSAMVAPFGDIYVYYKNAVTLWGKPELVTLVSNVFT